MNGKQKELINNFMDNEFDAITSMTDIYEEIVKIGDECKKKIIGEIDDFEKQTLKAIGTLIDEKGKEEGVEQLKLIFRQFNVEIKQKLRNCIIYECLESLKIAVTNKIDEISMYLKKHPLGYKFNITFRDFENLKDSIQSEQLDSIQEVIENIKLDLPRTEVYVGSKEYVKEKFYNFSDEYFAELRKKVNEIYKEFYEIVKYKIGTESEIRKFLKEKIVTPLSTELS